MGNIRRGYNRFITRNRNKGIPNLMLWICAGNAIVFLFWKFFDTNLPSYLYFNAEAIMHGQIWRLFSYIFTFASGQSFLFSSLFGALISIMFYYWIGSTLENVWGTLRFNLFYLCGILLSDLYAMLIYWIFGAPLTMTSDYINLSMFLAVATLAPEQRVLLMMIIPVKMKWLAWVDIGFTLYGIISGLVRAVKISFLGAFYTTAYVLIALFPLVALLNYLLFFGRDTKNLLPNLRRSPRRRKRSRVRVSEPQPNPDWAKNYRSSTGQRPYRHKCTVCGRTDTDCPDLEFRYCSRCKGYFCYCIDHINNHTHVQ